MNNYIIDVCYFSGGLSTTSIVRVLITDVNDNRPIFEPREYNVTLRAETPVNGLILRCFASDTDAGFFGQVAYRISGGNEANIFRIDRTTGEIHVARPSQLARSSTYLLNVTATDGAGLKSILDASVQITTTTPGQRTAVCDRPTYSISIKENVAQNTFIGSIRDPSVSSSTGESRNLFPLSSAASQPILIN